MISICQHRFDFIYITALYKAVEKQNIEVVKLLLSYRNININVKNIFLLFCIYEITSEIKACVIHFNIFNLIVSIEL